MVVGRILGPNEEQYQAQLQYRLQTTDTVSATVAHNEFPANPIRAVGLEAGRITDE
jgi:hypothetical protein